MFDLVQLKLQAGDGGNGKVSFRREKFIPKGGPDGGNGGNGGNIYIRGSKHLNTLQHFSGVKEYVAKRGQDGGSQHMIGYKGEDIVLEVPIGTIVWLLAESKASRSRRLHQAREGAVKMQPRFTKYYLDKPSGNPPLRDPQPLIPVAEDSQITSSPDEDREEFEEVTEEQIFRSDSLKNINVNKLSKLKLIEITEDGQEILVCQGGFGGRGNDAFKSSTNTTPFEAEYGTFGEQKLVLFELRLLADVGLVGYPNAGKSTFLSIVTKANPKIANYPFTTLEPNLGVMSLAGTSGSEGKDIVVADIPGLIEGASEGKGLGFDFLRHVQACQMLVYMLTLEEAVIYDDSLTDDERAHSLLDQYKVLKKELHNYSPELTEKPSIVTISKSDLFREEVRATVQALFKKNNCPAIFFSTLTKEGVDEVKQHIFITLQKSL